MFEFYILHSNNTVLPAVFVGWGVRGWNGELFLFWFNNSDLATEVQILCNFVKNKTGFVFCFLL